MPEIYEIEPDAENSNPHTDGFDSFKQWRLPNGNFITLGVYQQDTMNNGLRGPLSQDKQTPPDGVPERFNNYDAIAKAVAKSEAALSLHTFKNNRLEFSEVFNHHELNVRSNRGYNVRGAEVGQQEGERYTSLEEWNEKFSYNPSGDYTGDLDLTFSYRVESTSGDTTTGEISPTPSANVRLVRTDSEGTEETLEKWRTASDEYQEESYTINQDLEEEYTYSLQLKTSNGDYRAYLKGIEVTPYFEHEGEEYALAEVSRVPLDPKELFSRIE